MSIFSLTDFDSWTNRNMTVRISIQDQNKQWIEPPFTEGFFAIAPRAPSPNLQGGVANIFERNTVNSPYVRFFQSPDNIGQWYLDSDILPADTTTLIPGTYYYETSILLSNGWFTLRTGLFRLRPTST